MTFHPFYSIETRTRALSTTSPLCTFLLSPPVQKVAPFVESFSFPRNLTRGKRLRVICTVTEGDRPLQVEWRRDGARVAATRNVAVRRLDEYTRWERSS